MNTIQLETLDRARNNLGTVREVRTSQMKDTVLQEEVYKASPGQENLWFVDQMFPGCPAFNMPEGWRIKGSLHATGLQWAFEALARRHEILRTAFTVNGNYPCLQVSETVNVSVPLVDLSVCPVEARESELDRLVKAEAQRGFDLLSAPLWRTVLFRVSAEDHFLVITMHHSISDAWSMNVLARELAELYGAWLAGRSNNLPKLPLQFIDYVKWQRTVMEGDFCAEEAAYWRNKMAAPLPIMQLPLDFSRPALRSYQGATQFFQLPAELVDGLKALARQQRVTLFIVLLAAFKALLCRFTRQSDIIVGSPFASRQRKELEGLVGFFVNTYPLRTDCGGTPSFVELVNRVRTSVLEATANSTLPADTLLQELPTARDSARHPLYQVVFGLQPTMQKEWSLPGTRAEHCAIDNGGAKFDWTLLLTETGGAIEVRSEFDSALFRPDTVERWGRYYQVLLQGIVSNPNRKITEYPLTLPAERHELMGRWSGKSTPYERHLCTHELFELSSEKWPDRTALWCGTQRCTYRELNNRANTLARRLKERGVQPGEILGVCLPRSFDLIVALLAVLKSGGAYLPLDHGYPAERLRYMLEDSGAALVIVNQESQSAFTNTGASLFTLSDSPPAHEAAVGNFKTEIGPENLAYVMYTSGSTGQPKAAAIPHRAILRLVRNTDYANFGPDEVFLQLAPVSFDASTLEIWGALLNGASLVIPPPGTLSLQQLARVIRENRISILWLTSGLFHQMVDEHLEDLRGVRQLLAGGDVLSPAHVRKALHTLDQCRIINGYGPTENTTFTCCHTVAREAWLSTTVPIGRPIANTRVYILNDAMEPEPVGVPGELYASGDGLAAGYLNSPELSNSKFVQWVPENGAESVRLYRTGDLARWLPDGTIEFLGRLDGQVKVRGYRVELGEVEAVLCQSPQVQQAVVIALPDKTGNRQLVGYYVPASGGGVSPDQLRDYLSHRLPAYLVPFQLVPLLHLSLTANGKIDKSALPTPASLRDGIRVEAPQSGTEEQLARIWRQVLGISSIGREENFFALGGHSLMAMQVMSRVTQTFGVELPVRVIFEAPTLAVMAALIDKQEKDDTLPAITPDAGGIRATELLARLSDLSEAEIDALLQDSELKDV